MYLSQENTDGKQSKIYLSSGNGQTNSELEEETVRVDAVDNSEQWMQLSMVLDRLGLLIFVTALGCGCYQIFTGILTED